ncbi:MAG: hypothetical protein QXF15_03335, partial [Candidatus Aenigmatarchaeota archaeon]
MKKLKKISIKKIKEVKVFPKFKIPVLAFSKKIKHEKIDFKIEKERKIIEFPEGKEIDFTYNI